MFQCIEPYLPQEIQMINLEYAGHGSRMREPFYSDMNAAVEDMYSNICKNLTESDEYMLFGYSMGSLIVSATLAEVIRRKELPLPKQIFLAAHVPDLSGHSLSEKDLENDDVVKKTIIRFGGVPEDIVQSAIFWKLYMPIYKSDYRLMCSFNFDSLKLRANIPTSIFYCEEDTALKDLRRWERYFTQDVRYYSFQGGHFFIKENAEKIADLVFDRI